jgi:Protein of unknown function (DUF2971)
MLLDRYFGSHYVDTLQSGRLKTSRISAFNDPFEFMYVSSIEAATVDQVRQLMREDASFLPLVSELSKKVGFPLPREALGQLVENEPWIVAKLAEAWPEIAKRAEKVPLERRKEIIDQELRAICFSDARKVEPLDEILLWAHYADKHRGVRIRFDFPCEKNRRFEIIQMRYSNERVKVSLAPWDEKQALEAILESARVKSSAWGYEREFRLFTKVGLCEGKEIMGADGSALMEHFFAFERSWVKLIDFGVLFPEREIQSVLNLLKVEYPRAVGRKALFHESQYALGYDRII